MAKTRTPQEIKKAQDEGNAYIREREKLASRAGVNSARAAEMLQPGEQVKFEEENAARAKITNAEAAKKLLADRATNPQQAQPGQMIAPGQDNLPVVSSNSPLIIDEKTGLNKYQSGGLSSVPGQLMGVAGRAAAVAPAIGLAGEVGTGLNAAEALTKTGISKALSTQAGGFVTNAGKWALGLFGANKLINIPSQKIASMDSAITQIGKGIPTIMNALKINLDSPEKTLGNLDNAEAGINIYEQKIQENYIYDYKRFFNPEELAPTQEKIKRIRKVLDNAKFIAATTQVSGVAPTAEDLAAIQQQLDEATANG